MALTVETFVKEIESMSVLELNTLVKALEEKFGVSAAMMAAPAAAAGGAAPAAAAEEQTEFTCRPQGRRREQDQRHQSSCARSTRPRPQGGQGPRREPRHAQGRRLEGRGRLDQEEVRGCRREGGDQVIRSTRCSCRPAGVPGEGPRWTCLNAPPPRLIGAHG